MTPFPLSLSPLIPILLLLPVFFRFADFSAKSIIYLFLKIYFVCLCVVRFSSNDIGNDAVPSFSGIADFSPDSATCSPPGILLPM